MNRKHASFFPRVIHTPTAHTAGVRTVLGAR